jgi:hypothetical protein
MDYAPSIFDNNILDMQFRHRLKDNFGIDPEAFIDWICNSQAYVSGGLVLQTILGKTWPDSDMDLYMNHTSYSKLGSVLEDYKQVFNEYNYERLNDMVDDIFTYVHKTLKKQVHIMIVRSNTALSMSRIFDTFDNTAVCNWYDGENWCIGYPKTVDKVGFIKRAIDTTVEKRIEKYIKRGFQLYANYSVLRANKPNDSGLKTTNKIHAVSSSSSEDEEHEC